MNWRPIASSGCWISPRIAGGDCYGVTLLHGHQGVARLGPDQARRNKSVGVVQCPLAGERLSGHGGRA